MKLALGSLALLLTTATVGCGALMPGGGAGSPQGAAADKPSNHFAIPKESKDIVRKSEQDAYTQGIEAENEALDKAEKDALKALNVTLGKQAAFQGMPVPSSASTALKGLKAAKVKLRIEPVTNEDGQAVNDDFLQLKDSYTDRMPALARKMAEHQASPAEIKEMQSGVKYVTKLNDLRWQVQQISMATMSANSHVQTSSLAQMMRVAQLVKSHKMYEMEMTAADYDLVKKGLATQKRAEAIAGVTMAMMAAFQAVINGDADPKALDMIADGTVKAFPIKAEVTDQEAKDYVAALGANVGKVKGRYEAMIRKVHGDKKYERNFKAGIDQMFSQFENAQNQKSASQMADDHWDQYKKDIATCKSGIDPAADGRLGPSCKAVFRAAQSGDTSQLLPGVKKAFDATGGMPSGGNNGAKLGGREGNALDGATALAGGDVDGALDAAGKMFPADSTIGASLQGIAALKKGDAKGAIKAAISLIPIPGLKEAFGFAAKLFG